jgi:hypothetical protein
MGDLVLGNFTGQAAAYGRARPGYPEQLVEQLLECAGVRAGDKVVARGGGSGAVHAVTGRAGIEGLRRGAQCGDAGAGASHGGSAVD